MFSLFCFSFSLHFVLHLTIFLFCDSTNWVLLKSDVTVQIVQDGKLALNQQTCNKIGSV